jgi:hypothetical protein
MCAYAGRGSDLEWPHDADARDQREDPAQDRDFPIIAGYWHPMADAQHATRGHPHCRPGVRRDGCRVLRRLQNKPAEVGVLGEIADVLLHVVGVDLDGLAMAVGC